MKIIIPTMLQRTLPQHPSGVYAQHGFVELDKLGQFSDDPQGAEALVVPWELSSETIKDVVKLPSLRWIHSVSVGMDHTLPVLPKRDDLIVTNARGVFNVPIAEVVLAYILAILKRVFDLDQQQRDKTWKLLRLRECADTTVGIVGAGGIGEEIAKRCKALGMQVIATRRDPSRTSSHVDTMLAAEHLSRLLVAADFVVLTVPLTDSTRAMISRDALRGMRANAWLINVARGPLVDEAALVHALAEHWIAGAVLDVFDNEPLSAEHPLWDFPNAIITPHNSWSTPHLLERETDLFVDNLTRYVNKQPLLNVVDVYNGY